ncbi:MAG: hypothetical protein ABSH50_16545, partial [Bryobacteraceae bacterium]
ISAKGVFRAFRRFALFPHNSVPSLNFASDEEAILNDWAVVGADLFDSMQKYKSIDHDVTAADSAEFPVLAR